MRKKKYTLALGLSRELKRPRCPETIIGPHHLLDNPSLKPYLKITHKVLYSGECVRACASVCESACVPFPRVCVRALRFGRCVFVLPPLPLQMRWLILEYGGSSLTPCHFQASRPPGTLYNVPCPTAPRAPRAYDTHNTLTLSAPQLILERPPWLPGEL